MVQGTVLVLVHSSVIASRGGDEDPGGSSAVGSVSLVSTSKWQLPEAEAAAGRDLLSSLVLVHLSCAHNVSIAHSKFARRRAEAALGCY